MQKYKIITYGCQMNIHESEKIAGTLQSMGYVECKDENDADVIVFNTCCIRDNAEKRALGNIGAVKHLKKSKPGLILAVVGCMTQQDGAGLNLRQKYPYVDIVLGTNNLAELKNAVLKLKNSGKKSVLIDPNERPEVLEGELKYRTSGCNAWLNIMYGCNNFCTYCIVPYVRGRERSRKKEDILAEIKELAENGYKEITLLGQNVNSYQGERDIKNFAQLLKEIEKIDGIEIIRFVSPHPKDFTDDVIEVISKSNKISKLIHLPLQSGSTNVLQLMNRKYTKEQYLNLVQKMRMQIKDVTFSTDIIVGFPGENEKDFEDTLDVVSKVNFEQVFMFIYSKRAGTPAANKEEQVDEKAKHERFNRLKKLVDEQVEKNNLKYIETVQRILVDGISKTNREMLTGRTSTNKVVIFEGKKGLIGQVVDVKIESEHKWYLRGNII